MPNHWHIVVWPGRDGDLPAFMQQVTNMHVKRWKEHHHEIGYGQLYQGRYKCFPVETEDYFYQVVRYVERNALRANLVERAESWRWSSLRRVEREDPAFPILSTWPLPRPADWLQIVPSARQLVRDEGEDVQDRGNGFRRNSGPGWRLSLPFDKKACRMNPHSISMETHHACHRRPSDYHHPRLRQP